MSLRFPTRYSQDKSGCKVSYAHFFAYAESSFSHDAAQFFIHFTNALFNYIVVLLTVKTRGRGGSVVELRIPEREVQGSNPTVPPYV